MLLEIALLIRPEMLALYQVSHGVHHTLLIPLGPVLLGEGWGEKYMRTHVNTNTKHTHAHTQTHAWMHARIHTQTRLYEGSNQNYGVSY